MGWKLDYKWDIYLSILKGGPKKETIKVNTSGGLTEGELRLTDEVPTSAVELIVKQKVKINYFL